MDGVKADQFTAWAYRLETDEIVHRRMLSLASYEGPNGVVLEAAFDGHPETRVLCAGRDHAPIQGWNYLHSGWGDRPHSADASIVL